jgi:hypothetical protein
MEEKIEQVANGRHILVVDDDEAVGHMIRVRLFWDDLEK